MAEKTGKRILLVMPYGNIPAYWFPLALGYLKSNIPPPHEVMILDSSLRDITAASPEFMAELEAFRPDIVGVTTATSTYVEALEVLHRAKEFNGNVITVMGGPHPSIYPDAIMRNGFVDYLFRGEADLSFPVFLERLESGGDFTDVKGLVYRANGGLVKNQLEAEEDIDKIKIPDYRALHLDEYIRQGYNYGGFYGRTAPIWLTRGCPYMCQFCSAPMINGRKIRAHSKEYIISWIDILYKDFGIRQFSIVDDNFTFYAGYAKDFCNEIIRLKGEKHFAQEIYFTTPNGIRMDRVDKELLLLMRKAGWHGLTVAPESGSRKTLKRMRKGLNPDAVPGIISMIKDAGLSVRGLFMVGYPGETREDIDETIKLIRKCNLDSILIGKFNPLPGTPVYDDLVRSGEIPPDYMRSQPFKAFLPFQKKNEGVERQKVYSPPGLENLNLFWMMLREHILLFFRNPYSAIYFIKYYGVWNIMEKLLFLARKTK